MTRTVQVVGAGGSLGSYICRAAEARGWNVVKDAFDVTAATRTCIRSDVVINCAAVIDRRAPQFKMIAVNALGPRMLRYACDDVGSRLVHISTDTVFDGPGPHPEAEEPRPRALEALVRLFGEIRDEPHVTIRTSFIGTSGKGLIRDIATATESRPVIASNKLLWNGVTSLLGANLVLDIACQKVSGVVHIPGCHTTRWQLCMDIAKWLSVDERKVRQDDTYIADRRLASEKWLDLGFEPIECIPLQLERMERPI
jgi:dTDP-4-dehydrorhamnose reductase